MGRSGTAAAAAFGRASAFPTGGSGAVSPGSRPILAISGRLDGAVVRIRLHIAWASGPPGGSAWTMNSRSGWSLSFSGSHEHTPTSSERTLAGRRLQIIAATVRLPLSISSLSSEESTAADLVPADFGGRRMAGPFGYRASHARWAARDTLS
ncbi:MAG: hypothetical protein ABSH26_08435 [Opitutaceae bacterium]